MNENETIGLYPDIIISNDDKYLCFSRLESDDHLILNVPKEHYSIRGNTITLFSECALKWEKLATLIGSHFAYRLLRTPEIIPESKVHNYEINNDEALNALKRGLYTLTFILDDIVTMPELHYPPIFNSMRNFTSDILDSDRIKVVLHNFRYVKRIRLLSNDILNSEVLALEELRLHNLEVIVNQSYFLNHLGKFSTLPTGCKLIVYLDEVTHIDEAIILSHHVKMDASFFCEIKTFEDLRRYEELNIPVTPFPSSHASEELVHHMLDYSLQDLLKSTTHSNDLLLKSSINPLFFGNIVVDNEGKINTYPYEDSVNGGFYDIGIFLKKFKNNYYWNIRRPDFFNKCKNCALVGLCPPLSSFEINLWQTFCSLV